MLDVGQAKFIKGEEEKNERRRHAKSSPPECAPAMPVLWAYAINSRVRFWRGREIGSHKAGAAQKRERRKKGAGGETGWGRRFTESARSMEMEPAEARGGLTRRLPFPRS